MKSELPLDPATRRPELETTGAWMRMERGVGQGGGGSQRFPRGGALVSTE